METKGAVLATALGYGVAIIINLLVIKMSTRYSFTLVWRRSVLIIMFTLVMFAGAGGTYKLLSLFLSPQSVWQSLVMILACGLVGVVIYGYLGIRSKLVNLLFGKKWIV